MKKLILGLTLAMLMLFNQSVLADSKPIIEAKVNGTVDQGQKIQILINIKDISSLYAGQVEFKYDTSVLKVESIEQGDLITKPGINRIDFTNKIDAENGKATYIFTCTGQINGFSGTGTFIKINAEVLKKDSFHINSKPFLKQTDNDMNLRLEIVNSDPNMVDYQFIPYEFSIGSTQNSSNNGTSNTNIATNGSTSENNSTNTAETDEKKEPDKSKDTNSQTAVNSNNSDTGKDEKQSANKPADNAVSSKEFGSEKNNNIKIYAASLLVLILIAGSGAYYVLKNKKRKDINDNTDVKL